MPTSVEAVRDGEEAEAVQAGDALTFPCDPSDADAAEEVVEEAKEDEDGDGDGDDEDSAPCRG